MLKKKLQSFFLMRNLKLPKIVPLVSHVQIFLYIYFVFMTNFPLGIKTVFLVLINAPDQAWVPNQSHLTPTGVLNTTFNTNTTFNSVPNKK